MVRRPLALLIAGAAALMAACGESKPAVSGNPNVKIDPVLADVVLGDPNAPVTIIEYGSLACPHCRDFWMQQMPQLKPKYIDTGKAKYIFRDLTMGGAMAPLSDAAAAISRCAGKDKYYATITDFFQHQFDIAQAASSPEGAGPILAQIGERAGLDRDQTKACIDSPAIAGYIRKQRDEKPASVSGLPSVLVDGEFVKNSEPGKELSAEDVGRVIDAKLGVAPSPAPSATASAPPPG